MSGQHGAADTVPTEAASLQPSPEDNQASAQELAREPQILDRFEEALKGLGVVGEERTAMLLYLAVTSRLLLQPISVAVKGPSSGGKSYIVDQVLRFFPGTAFHALTAMSERALAYSEEPLQHRMLVIFEAAGLTGDFTSYLVRSLLSEGRICYETVEKTKSGLKARMIEREGPTGLIVTTTAIALHPENETRLLSVTVADTPTQTRAVLLALASEGRDTSDLSEWHSLQRWLEGGEHRVAIPYSKTLADLIPPVAVRLRRDFGAVLNLIRAHAILHQANRSRDSEGRIVASIDDYAVVRNPIADLVAEGVGATVPETMRQTVRAVEALGAEEGRPTEHFGTTVSAVAKRLNLDESSAYRRVQSAVKRGYLSNLETGRGRPARLVVSSPIPDEQTLLPSPELLQPGCGLAVGTRGVKEDHVEDERGDAWEPEAMPG